MSFNGGRATGGIVKSAMVEVGTKGGRTRIFILYSRIQAAQILTPYFRRFVSTFLHLDHPYGATTCVALAIGLPFV